MFSGLDIIVQALVAIYRRPLPMPDLYLVNPEGLAMFVYDYKPFVNLCKWVLGTKFKSLFRIDTVNSEFIYSSILHV